MDSKPRFSKGEELANAISHGIGLVLAIAATVIIIVVAVQNGDPWQIVSSSVFGATLVLLYFSSTMNHSLAHGKAKDFFHNFDQIAIYLLIAGTYTPIALTIMRHDQGWLMFGIEWGLALTGLMVKAFLPNKFEKGVNVFVIISYVLMGWLLLFFIKPLFENLSTFGLVMIFAGGLFYSLGILFFKMKKLKYAHLIWHLMVIGGSVCHYLVVLNFMLNN